MMVSMRLLLIVAFLLLAFTPARAGDADTLTVDGTVYRLDGIDAPEIDQNCIEVGGVYPCGQLAIEALEGLIAGRRIHCQDLGPDRKYPRRRIGRCTVDGIDLHRWLVRNGWALNFEPYAYGRFKDDEREAQERGAGMWKGCFVAPHDFRRWNKHTAPLLGPRCPVDARRKLFPDDAVMPPGCEIKGKFALRALLTGHRGIYHVPGCSSYRRTKRPDRWFCSEEDAVAAGFRLSFTC
jgi:endonuclease YncB( thermonuclease family)